MRLSECLEQRLLAVAERRRRAPEPGDDALSLLVQQDGGLDRHALVGQMRMLFIAADEAAHNALTWLPFLLAQHPAVLTDVRDELDGRLRGAALTVEDLDGLPLLDRVVIDTPYVVATRENSRLTAWARQAHHRARELMHGR